MIHLWNRVKANISEHSAFFTFASLGIICTVTSNLTKCVYIHGYSFSGMEFFAGFLCWLAASFVLFKPKSQR
ncbi:hypothetical protein Alches_25740 [Alicyclobacillus hesperidum subsp. aegles]|nr:hypothetical protein Alches_25740 [Alicyclobacillus hesperidum subsp. aegles]